MEFLEKKDVPEHFLTYVATILTRFLRYIPVPADHEACAVAALYVATRHPLSFPNVSTRESYSSKFDIKQSSIEWSLARIIETLGFITVRDTRHFPYYLDPKGVAVSVIKSLTKTKTLESLAVEMNGMRGEVEEVVDSVLVDAIEEMNMLPEEFRGDLHKVVGDYVTKTREKYGDFLTVTQQVFL